LVPTSVIPVYPIAVTMRRHLQLARECGALVGPHGVASTVEQTAGYSQRISMSMCIIGFNGRGIVS
jgi:hypothetical protein